MLKIKKKPFGFENLFTVVKILTIETHYFFTQIKHRIRPFFLNISSDERICINCTSDDTASSLAKGYDSGPPSLHPWRI